MRKLAALLLAVPVLATFYVPILLRRSTAARIGLAMGVGGLVALGALGLISPSGTAATKPLPAIVPLSQAAFTTTIAAGQELDAPVELAFSGPMDQTSVAAARRPLATRVRLTGTDRQPGDDRSRPRWAARRLLHDHGPGRRPRREWGRWPSPPGPSSSPVTTTVQIAATARSGDVAVSAQFTFRFDRPVAIGGPQGAGDRFAVRGALDVVASAPAHRPRPHPRRGPRD